MKIIEIPDLLKSRNALPITGPFSPAQLRGKEILDGLSDKDKIAIFQYHWRFILNSLIDDKKFRASMGISIVNFYKLDIKLFLKKLLSRVR